MRLSPRPRGSITCSILVVKDYPDKLLEARRKFTAKGKSKKMLIPGVWDIQIADSSYTQSVE